VNQTKTQRIVEDIRRRIEAGELGAGTRLPGARRLAVEYGVSVITTTRALDELEGLGYVLRRERSGTYVCKPPLALESIVLIVSTGLESASTACIDYWRGISSCAESHGIRVRLVRAEDGSLASLVSGYPALRVGFIGVMTSPSRGFSRLIRERAAPYVSLGMEDLDTLHCVTEDRRRACRALVERMFADGYRRFGFIGNPRAGNHVLARLAFEDTVRRFGGAPGLVCAADDSTILGVTAGVLSEKSSLDALIIMGGNMPVAALPAVLGCGRRIGLGVMSENSTVLQLGSVAYVASYSQAASGRLAFSALSRVARGELTGSFTLYTPFEILAPGAMA